MEIDIDSELRVIIEGLMQLFSCHETFLQSSNL